MTTSIRFCPIYPRLWAGKIDERGSGLYTSNRGEQFVSDDGPRRSDKVNVIGDDVWTAVGWRIGCGLGRNEFLDAAEDD